MVRLVDAAPSVVMVQLADTMNLSIQLLILHSVHLHQIKQCF